MTDWTPEREVEAKKWADICKDDVVGIGAYLPDAIREIVRQREELRIAKNSWNFEEGQRCFAERDRWMAAEKDAVLHVCSLRAQLDEYERVGTAAAEVARLKAERDAMVKKLSDALMGLSHIQRVSIGSCDQ